MRRHLRPIFQSSELNELFWRDGAVVAQLLTAEECESLARFYRDSAPDSGLGFHATMFSRDTAYRARVDEHVRQLLWPKLESYFTGYRPLLGSFVVKEHSRLGSEVSIHQDWTFVDETVARSLNVWCPLIDTDRNNGGQFIFKGSHRIVPTMRGPFFPNPFVSSARVIEDEFLEEVPLAAGQAIIYDHSLVHATPPNLSRQTRVAANLVLVPRGEQLVHCYLDRTNGNTRPEVFAVDDEFFIRYEIGQRPTGVRPLGSIDLLETVLTVDQLLQAKASAAA